MTNISPWVRDEYSSDIQGALQLISDYGGIDGGHHKQWVLDQVVRLLTNSDSAYADWLSDHEAAEDGIKMYEWNEGIIP